jgi:hypothetical protein
MAQGEVGRRKRNEAMNSIKTLVALGCALTLLAGTVLAQDKNADKAPKKLTCCQEAAAKGKNCTHKCCVSAHKEDKSCERCNPNKEDLNLKKAEKKPAKT